MEAYLSLTDGAMGYISQKKKLSIEKSSEKEIWEKEMCYKTEMFLFNWTHQPLWKFPNQILGSSAWKLAYIVKGMAFQKRYSHFDGYLLHSSLKEHTHSHIRFSTRLSIDF